MINDPDYNKVCEIFFPVFKKYSATDNYSVTLSGSFGKGLTDKRSDYDFRIYFDEWAESAVIKSASAEIGALVEEWKLKGVYVDGVWPRTYADIDGQLEMWLSGCGTLTPIDWTVWGYNVLTDVYNQIIIEDKNGKAAEWKTKLTPYPMAIKQTILSRHAASLKYWKTDYHYKNKVERGDIVFIASITSRLVNDMVQVIYAVNEFFYPGDGMNLDFSQQFKLKPDNFESRVSAVLRIPETDNHISQYNSIIQLIDETLRLAADAGWEDKK